VLCTYKTFKNRDFSDYHFFIFDECQKGKNPSTQIGKAMFNTIKTAVRVLLMSGNPQPQGYLDSLNYFKMFTGDKTSASKMKRIYFYYSPVYTSHGAIQSYNEPKPEYKNALE